MRPRIAGLLLAATATLAAGCGGGEQGARGDAQPRGVPVRTARAEKQDLDETLLLTGTLKPRAQVELVAEVAARLVAISRDEGARVAKGELLARLDDTDYRLAHARARAALEVAEANRQHAVVEKERADNLLNTGGVTDKDHLAAQVNLRVAEAALAQARAETEIAATQLGRTQVTAPFGGRVARRHADAGAMLAAGTSLFTLVDDSLLEFEAQIASRDLAKVKLGASALLSIDALPDARIEGRIARIEPLVDERSRSFRAVIEVPGRPGLVGGLFARAALRVGRVEGALVIPPAALVRDGSDPLKAAAFVVRQGRAEKLTLALGVEAPDGVQVTSGLAAGDVVVLDPPTALSSGAPVELQNGGRAPAAK
ncbi:MAG: efflux RND transporter periplasmic adaptor subunit [Vicinamibacteria bacterium]